MTPVTAAVVPLEPEDEAVLGEALCHCGALAPIVVQLDYDLVCVVIRCPCGWFVPADGDEQ